MVLCLIILWLPTFPYWPCRVNVIISETEVKILIFLIITWKLKACWVFYYFNTRLACGLDQTGSWFIFSFTTKLWLHNWAENTLYSRQLCFTRWHKAGQRQPDHTVASQLVVWQTTDILFADAGSFDTGGWKKPKYAWKCLNGKWQSGFQGGLWLFLLLMGTVR